MDELLNAVRQAAGEGYTVYGELGRETDADAWYLARELATGKLLAMRLYTEQVDADGRKEYALEVARELDAKVSVGLADCPKCGNSIRKWARFCPKCGAPLADGEQPASPAEREALLARVREEAGDVYEVLGEMPWTGGGVVYFALERASGRLVRLRVKDEPDGAVIGETRAMMPLKQRVSAGYMTVMQAAPQPAADAAPKTPRPPPHLPPKAPAWQPVPKSPSPFSPAPAARPHPQPHPPPQPARGRGTDWGAPLSAREWTLVAIIVVLILVVVRLMLR